MTIGMFTFLLLPYILIPLLIWVMTWKGLALWAAGKRREKAWFIALFLINTIGILEIIYLLTRKPKVQPRPARRKR
jgi:Family of unknown function (DUF5652)